MNYWCKCKEKRLKRNSKQRQECAEPMSRSAMDKHSIPVVTVFPDLFWLGMLHSKSQHRHRRYEVNCAVTLVGEPWSDPSYPSIVCAAPVNPSLSFVASHEMGMSASPTALQLNSQTKLRIRVVSLSLSPSPSTGIIPRRDGKISGQRPSTDSLVQVVDRDSTRSSG